MKILLVPAGGGDGIQVDEDIVMMFGTLAKMIGDLGLESFEDGIPLPNIEASTLMKVVEWCTEHKDAVDALIAKEEAKEKAALEAAEKKKKEEEEKKKNETTSFEDDNAAASSSSTTVPGHDTAADKDFLSKIELEVMPSDQAFFEVDISERCALLLAADYLEIEPLIKMWNRTMGNNMKDVIKTGRTFDEKVEALRQYLNIENDWTEKEYAKKKHEHRWCLEFVEAKGSS